MYKSLAKKDFMSKHFISILFSIPYFQIVCAKRLDSIIFFSHYQDVTNLSLKILKQILCEIIDGNFPQFHPKL